MNRAYALRKAFYEVAYMLGTAFFRALLAEPARLLAV